MMIDGETIAKIDGNSYYTRETARQALAGTAVIETKNITAGVNMTATLQNKNRDETSWTTLQTFSTITDVGVSTLDFTNAEELLRLQLDFGSADAATDMFTFLFRIIWKAGQ